MNKYISTLFILIAFFVQFGCSLAKDAPDSTPQASTPTAKSQSTHMANTSIWEELHEREKHHAAQDLNKNPKSNVAIVAADKKFETHINKFDQITQLVLSDKTLEALESLKDFSQDCPDLETSMMYSYMRLKQNNDFKKIDAFLRKIKCSSQATRTHAMAIYHLEVQRQFQRNFKDLSMLGYLIRHPKVYEPDRIPLSNKGIFVSLRLLYEISIWAQFEINATEAGSPVKHLQNPLFAGANTYEIPSEIPVSDIDYLYVKDGRAAVGIPRFSCFKGYPMLTPCSQIVQYMHGFQDTPEDWQATIDNIFALQSEETIE